MGASSVPTPGSSPRRARALTLPLLLTVGLLLTPLATAQGDVPIDWVALNVRDESGNIIDPQLPAPAEGLKIEAAFENYGEELTTVQLRAEIRSASGDVIWDGKSAYLDVEPGGSVPFSIPVEGALPDGEFTVYAFLMTDGGEMTAPRESTFFVQGPMGASNLAPAAWSPWGLITVVLGAVVVTAAGIGVGLHDRGLQARGKPLLGDGAITGVALAGGLLGMLIVFKTTDHPERHVERPAYLVLAVQGALLLALIWWFL